MSNERCPDYVDERAVLQRAVQSLLKLDAEGCRIAKAVADAVVATYNDWNPREPTDEFDASRAEGVEQIEACRELCEAMIGDYELALQIAPLAEARQKYQTEVEEKEADEERRVKRYRRRHPEGRRTAQILSVVPKNDDPSGPEDEG